MEAARRTSNWLHFPITPPPRNYARRIVDINIPASGSLILTRDPRTSKRKSDQRARSELLLTQKGPGKVDFEDAYAASDVDPEGVGPVSNSSEIGNIHMANCFLDSLQTHPPSISRGLKVKMISRQRAYLAAGRFFNGVHFNMARRALSAAVR